MTNILLSILYVLLLIIGCSQPPKYTNNFVPETNKQSRTILLSEEESIKDGLSILDPSVVLRTRLMAYEIADFWQYYYEKKGWPVRAKREKQFVEFSQYLAEAVVFYQDNPTDLGGQLPVHENVHIFFAMMVAKETAVVYDARGKLGEVGLIQIHPKNTAALNGYKPYEVRRNPRLGLVLGVRWMTFQISECRIDIDNWKDSDWLKPLSVYAAGTKAIIRKGKCRILQLAKRRLRTVYKYRKYQKKKITTGSNFIARL